MQFYFLTTSKYPCICCGIRIIFSDFTNGFGRYACVIIQCGPRATLNGTTTSIGAEYRQKKKRPTEARLMSAWKWECKTVGWMVMTQCWGFKCISLSMLFCSMSCVLLHVSLSFTLTVSLSNYKGTLKSQTEWSDTVRYTA